MVIRHEPPPHYRAPSAMMSNNSSSGAMHHSYHHPSHHHSMHHQPPHYHQHHAQRYYAPPPPPHHHPSPRSHHDYSPTHAQSPSHHAAVALQSMQHYQPYYPSHATRGHFAPHAPTKMHSPSKTSALNTNSVPLTTANTTVSENAKAEGFNMLIAAATSESVNSIDEEEPKVTVAKGILKKHPRGKQLVSPLESEEKAEHEEQDGVLSERAEDKEQEEDASKEAQSAGPLKKRRKVDGEAAASKGGNDALSSTSVFEKLHKLLTNESQAMEWLSHGKSFRVLRWDVMVEEVLPELFSGSETDIDLSIQTFRGQLKDCGFVEVKRGKDYGSYCHEFFVKDEPKLVCKITPNRTDLSPTYDIAQSGSSLDGGMEWCSTRRVAHSIFKLPRTEDGHQDVAIRGEQSHPSYLHMPVLTTTATASFAENWGTGEERNNNNHHHHHSSRHTSRSSSDMYFPRPYPPHNSLHRAESKEETGRSPKIIRFREDEEAAARSQSRMMHRHGSRAAVPPIEISPNDGHADGNNTKPLHYDMVQITPNPDYEQSKSTTTAFKPHFPVSRRGGRSGGGMKAGVSRHVRHASD